MEKQYQSTEILVKDLDKVRAFLASAPEHEAYELKLATEHSDGWWYGTYSEEQVVSVAHISNRVVHLYARESTPMSHMGNALAYSQGKRNDGMTHQLFGPDDCVLAFWQGFQRSGRSVVADIKLRIYALEALACAQNDAYTARRATLKDLPLVFEFMGEALIDELGMDMRRVGREAHEKNMSHWIQSQEVVLGFHRAKPAFVVKYSKRADRCFIEHAYFPVPMRRPKVMRGLNACVAKMLLEERPKLMVYVDASKSELLEALEEVGYAQLGTARLMRLR